MNDWSTEAPPVGIGLVFITCGDGNIRVVDSSNVTKELRGLCWIAWKNLGL